MCVAPSGNGWGIRFTTSVLANCVPLISQPAIVMPFEELMGFPSFSLRVDSEEQIQRLPHRLAQLSEARLLGMRQHLLNASRAFLWRGKRALAYNYTVLALCWRAIELRGQLRNGQGGSACASLAARLPGARPMPRLPEWFPASLVGTTERLRKMRREAALANGQNPP